MLLSNGKIASETWNVPSVILVGERTRLVIGKGEVTCINYLEMKKTRVFLKEWEMRVRLMGMPGKHIRYVPG